MVPLARDVRAAAGTAKLVFNEVPEFRVAIHRSVLPAWVRPDSLICIRAVGDSMEPTVHDGDLIALDHSKVEPIDRQMFVVSLGDDGLVVKRLRLRGERVWELVSDNETYDSRAVSEDDRVIGRVVWSGPPRDAPET